MTPQDQNLLSDFLSTLSLPNLAKKHNLLLTDLITWADRPDIAAAIADIIRIADLRSRALAATSSPQALATLSDLSTLDESPTTPIRLFRESTRKACAALLRHSKSKTNSRPRTHHKTEPSTNANLKTQPPAAQPTGFPRRASTPAPSLNPNESPANLRFPRIPASDSLINPLAHSPPHLFTSSPVHLAPPVPPHSRRPSLLAAAAGGLSPP